MSASPSLLLDGFVGWRAATSGLTALAGGSLAVDAMPGLAEPFGELGSQGVGCPGAMAVGPCERELYWVDDRGDLVRHAPLTGATRVETVPAIGGLGTGARRFRQSRGLTVLADGALAVSDTRGHRVLVFSAPPHALLAVVERIGRPGASRRLSAPWALASDACGGVFIVDRGNGRVVKVHRDGAFRGVVMDGLRSPTAIALSEDGTVAVLDSTRLVIRHGTRVETLPAPTGAVSLATDADANVYVGTRDGLIHAFKPQGDAEARTYVEVGAGVIGRDASVRLMAWTRAHSLLVAGEEPCHSPVQLWRVPQRGGFLPAGTLTTEPLDSGIEGCKWHRIEVEGEVPEGCAIEVATQTSERDTWTEANAPFEPGKPLVLGTDLGECLVQSPPGRYMRVGLRLVSSGVRTPTLRAVRLRFPRDSYLKYLPAIYQEDPESRSFLDRFLSIFQASFDGFDDRIDRIAELFDPLSTPADAFPWLAGWLALPLSVEWSTPDGLARGRAVLKDAWRAYQRRGTPDGLADVVKSYTGVDTSVVEHYRLRSLLVLGRENGQRLGRTSRLWSPDRYARLQLDAYSRLGYFRLTGAPEPAMEPLAWGAHAFSVFFVADPDRADETLKRVREVVEREKPAHTQATYCPVLPRMRVGVQSTVGVDSRLGVVTPMVLGRTSTLGYDSVLGCSPHEQDLRAGGATLHPRAGVSTRLQ